MICAIIAILMITVRPKDRERLSYGKEKPGKESH